MLSLGDKTASHARINSGKKSITQFAKSSHIEGVDGGWFDVDAAKDGKEKSKRHATDSHTHRKKQKGVKKAKVGGIEEKSLIEMMEADQQCLKQHPGETSKRKGTSASEKEEDLPWKPWDYQAVMGLSSGGQKSANSSVGTAQRLNLQSRFTNGTS
jgi:hypothetical protein